MNKQQLATEIIEKTTANLFISGKAGTGKTHFLKQISENKTKRMVVLSPTGVAAINAGGSTIHSFFRFDQPVGGIKKLIKRCSKSCAYR